MRYCLDTNVIIDILRGDPILLSNLKYHIQKKDEFFITPITLAELYKGAYLAKNQKAAITLVNEFCASVELLDFTKDGCELFGKKYLELKKEGKLTEEVDLMIACIALAHNAVFVTRNTKHFTNITELKLSQW